MKKNAKYVTFYVLPVPTKNLAAYKKLMKTSAKIMLEHGALEYGECMGDDVPKGKVTSFPMAVKAKAGEAVWVGWATYTSKKHSDSVMKKVMADPRMENMDIPFDGMRMFWGGFRVMINA